VAAKRRKTHDADVDLLAGLGAKALSSLLDAGAEGLGKAGGAYKRTGRKAHGEVLLKAVRRFAQQDERVQSFVQMAAMSSPVLAAKAEELGLLVKDAETTPGSDDPDIKDAEVV
jgi:hypothetical protein